ncbi:MAG: hypothetical protein AB7V42_16590 [Thermoleophilia bacterium]
MLSLRTGRGERRRGALAAAAAAGAVLALPAAAAPGDIELVSRATAGAPGDAASQQPSVSADGRFVAFSSDATNLTAEDDHTVTDVFVRDRQTGATELISRASGVAGAPAAGERSFAPSISADGRFVAFHSKADNLSPDDDDTQFNVYVRDRLTHETILVSRAVGPGGAGGDGSSENPFISADGRRVAFQSIADNLSGADAAGTFDVYVRDLDADSITLVSRASTSIGQGADVDATHPSISADGRRVAFVSAAGNLGGGPAGVARVYVRDLTAFTTTLASRADGASGAVADAPAEAPAISADGRHVAFLSTAANLTADPTDQGNAKDVFVRDLQAQTTRLVGPYAGGGEPGPATRPALSADGRVIAFVSTAPGLSAEDADPLWDVFVRDMGGGSPSLVSRSAGAGPGGDGVSDEPAITADGTLVAFSSPAANLSAQDVDPVVDVFLRDVRPVPPGGPGGPGGPVAPVVRCAGVRATIVGTSRSEVIRGTRRRDVIAALGGADRVLGGAGNDLICLGNGDDRGVGGPGDDRIIGGGGADYIIGGSGRDRLEGGPGRDRMWGADGRDILVGGPGPDFLDGLAGRDRALGGPGRDLCRAEVRSSCTTPGT